MDRVTAAVQAEFGALSPEALNWKPQPEAWSIAQNLDHLIVINKTYYPVIDQVRNNSYQLPWLGKWPFAYNMLGKMILNAVKPEQKRKTKTFPIWEPTQSNISGDIVQRFSQHQTEMKGFIVSCEDLLLKNTIIASPANKNIVYTLKTAFDIIIAHEQRHLEQARAIHRELA